eukprot:TRINITY_DN19957_c0_g2_i1.p1 TRINITY_DN19957_c0_g2~~TRINITY_DN19957_c0_g2_i1.p1  ORF type:complete len:834 (+),score=224.93 TRINITY_DN19957_c0_g2_i1:319-2820(+)
METCAVVAPAEPPGVLPCPLGSDCGQMQRIDLVDEAAMLPAEPASSSKLVKPGPIPGSAGKQSPSGRLGCSGPSSSSAKGGCGGGQSSPEALLELLDQGLQADARILCAASFGEAMNGSSQAHAGTTPTPKKIQGIATTLDDAAAPEVLETGVASKTIYQQADGATAALLRALRSELRSLEENLCAGVRREFKATFSEHYGLMQRSAAVGFNPPSASSPSSSRGGGSAGTSHHLKVQHRAAANIAAKFGNKAEETAHGDDEPMVFKPFAAGLSSQTETPPPLLPHRYQEDDDEPMVLKPFASGGRGQSGAVEKEKTSVVGTAKKVFSGATKKSGTQSLVDKLSSITVVPSAPTLAPAKENCLGRPVAETASTSETTKDRDSARLNVVKERQMTMAANWQATARRHSTKLVRGVSVMYHWTSLVVCSTHFDLTAGVLVLLNSLSIGFQVDIMARRGSDAVPAMYRAMEVIFCVIFSTELMLRLFVYGGAFFYMPGWQFNVFDMVVVSVQVVEEFLNFVAWISLEMVDLTFMRTIRMLRLIRVVRIFRVLHLISELRTLVTSIMSSLKSLGWTVAMLMLLIYMTSLFFTQLVTDHRNSTASPMEAVELAQYYGSMPTSILSFYQAVTGGVDWGDLTFPLVEYVNPLLGVIFSMYIAFVLLALMNVVTSVFVESALKSALDDQASFIHQNIKELTRHIPHGHLSYEMFQEMLPRPQMQHLLKAIDVDVSEARGIFDLLDFNSSGYVDAEEFTLGCLKLRGGAKALDVALLMRKVTKVSEGVRSQSKMLEILLQAMCELFSEGEASLGEDLDDAQAHSEAQGDDATGVVPGAVEHLQ